MLESNFSELEDRWEGALKDDTSTKPAVHRPQSHRKDVREDAASRAIVRETPEARVMDFRQQDETRYSHLSEGIRTCI